MFREDQEKWYKSGQVFQRTKIWKFKSVYAVSITKIISFANSIGNPLMNKPGSPCFKFCTTCDWLLFQCQHTFDQSQYSYLLPTQPRAMIFLWPLRPASVFVWIGAVGANKNFGRPRRHRPERPDRLHRLRKQALRLHTQSTPTTRKGKSIHKTRIDRDRILEAGNLDTPKFYFELHILTFFG